MSGNQFLAGSITGNDPFDLSRISLNNGLQQGDFYIGPQVSFCSHPVKTIKEYIAKCDTESEDYVILKTLHCSSNDERRGDCSQGKVLLHNEHLILSLLQDSKGVIHHHGLFKYQTKFILVLDCLMTHEFDKKGRYKDYINLQHYVINKKRLQQREALEIFCAILATLKDLHQRNIVHRDLKLGNVIYNKRSKDVVLINFALSKHLVRKDEPLTDQCGSLAYVSPDVLSGVPYDGKASDMWAMGVLLYTMVCGQFPFYDSDRQELFKKIRSADFVVPSTSQGEFQEAFELVKQLVRREPFQRLTALQTLDMAQQQLARLSDSLPIMAQLLEAQVVPDSGQEINFTDCVVPERKNISNISNMLLCEDTAAATVKIESVVPELEEHELSQITPLHYAESSYFSTSSSPQNVLLPAYNLSPHPSDLSFNPMLLQLPGPSTREPFPSTTWNSSYHPPASLHTSRFAQSSEQLPGPSTREPFPSTTWNGSYRADNPPAPLHTSRFAQSSEQLNTLSHAAQSHQRRRRNSSGSESRVRRHSAAPFRTLSLGPSIQRQRRRSHDVGDEQVDLLERLRIAATRRRSFSAPFHSPNRTTQLTSNNFMINHH